MPDRLQNGMRLENRWGRGREEEKNIWMKRHLAFVTCDITQSYSEHFQLICMCP